MNVDPATCHHSSSTIPVGYTASAHIRLPGGVWKTTVLPS